MLRSVPPSPQGALAELADLHGVQTSFVDVDGVVRTAGPDTLAGVLGALGADLDDVPGAVRAERLRRHVEVLSPVIASPPMVPQVVEVSLPRRVHPRDCWLTVEGEEGWTHRTRLMPAVHRPVGGATVEGWGMDRYEVRIAPSVAAVLPVGYYHLRVEGPGIDATSLVVVPPRCPEPDRAWGTFLPVHSIRPSVDWGIGTYPALGELASWTAELGGAFVATLPLFPMMAPEDPSPYLPVTRLAWNELYVDPTVLPEAELVPEARELLGSAAGRALGSALVDYPATASLVRQALEPMAEAAWATASSRRDELEAFARRRPEIAAYARFRGEREGEGPAADRAAGYYLYAQWAADRQLEAVGGQLLLDLPVGVHPDGFDAAWQASSFAAGAQGGAPPDTFFEDGQLWGFRPLHPQAIRRDGYRYLIDCLRHVTRRADVLRLDHVMSLHRLYWVPDGFDAGHGAYVRYPDEELRAVVSLEAARSATVVVGEDLGTVPDEVRAAMAQDGMLRSWVLQLEMPGPAARLPTAPEMSMASLGTHDLPRFAAWWGAGAADALRPCLDHLAAGPSRLMLVDIEDLWLERRPHNRPGTTTGNWRHRSDRTVDELKVTADMLARVDRLRAAGAGDLDAGERTAVEPVTPAPVQPPGPAVTPRRAELRRRRRRRRRWGGTRGDEGGER